MSLTPWREVIHPHRDVASGRYRQAEFAADLAQVLRGTAEAEYQDAGEFFARTFITRGMRALIVEALHRLAGDTGEPVVQLKTTFGGGKTHTLLALYHLLKSRAPAARLLGVPELLGEAGLDQVPEAQVAVLVGTALSVTQAHPDMAGRGVEVRTLWGEMAAQLGGPEGYALVAADDQAGTAPDSTTLCRLFAQVGPCLILMDEVVAFARNLWRPTQVVAAGTFEANMTFFHALTEAVKPSAGVIVVASIPESKIELGGAGGEEALASLEQIFGRVEAIWKAADAGEGFEIVRRRLFGPVLDEEALEATCQAFHALYASNPGDFPPEAGSSGYLERQRRAYPVHPEIFDRLYEDWSVLEHFHRTRGVLRLLSLVIHELWISNDQSPLIMPGSLPLYVPAVRDELTKYLSTPWTVVVDADVDGERSEPYKLDQSNARLGALSAARRVARAVFLGSAPSGASQQVRGIDDVRIRLGVAQPGDNLPVYADALARLQQQLSYLYWSGGRYWYDTHPNLKRTMEERAARITTDQILAEMERRLKQDRGQGDFRGVHICAPSADIQDEPTARLVILGPQQAHKRGQAQSPAIQSATAILGERGLLPRQYRNMLLFVAPDENIRDLHPEVQRFLAWQSIAADQEALNLDAHQVKQVREAHRASNEALEARLRQTYCWLLTPTQEGTDPVEWTPTQMTGDEGLAARASREARTAGSLITQWSPLLLKLELDRWFWKDQDHCDLKQLFESLATYVYLPRLQGEAVLTATVREGMRSEEFFGYAADVEEGGRYVDLHFGGGFAPVHLDGKSVLVKPDAARRQMEAPRAGGEESGGGGTGPEGPGGGGGHGGGGGGQPMRHVRRFYGTLVLDTDRMGGQAGDVYKEIVNHLVQLPGAEVKVTLDIDANVPGGIPPDKQRVVGENAKTMGFDGSEFEET